MIALSSPLLCCAVLSWPHRTRTHCLCSMRVAPNATLTLCCGVWARAGRARGCPAEFGWVASLHLCDLPEGRLHVDTGLLISVQHLCRTPGAQATRTRTCTKTLPATSGNAVTHPAQCSVQCPVLCRAQGAHSRCAEPNRRASLPLCPRPPPAAEPRRATLRPDREIRRNYRLCPLHILCLWLTRLVAALCVRGLVLCGLLDASRGLLPLPGHGPW
jgi:hypothetical protein